MKNDHSSDETLIGLVQRYSPSGQERNAVTWLVERMSSLGFSQSYIDQAGNAIGIIGKGPRQIVLLGHIDTVPGELPVHLEGDLLYGRGTVDAKGPLACFVEAAAVSGEK
ncbi:MAG: M20/M25/M40 family metallo-hydrolase, partial [Chloroflexi bacterium]